MWFLVINGKRVGPVTSDQVKSMFLKGSIDKETLIWTQNFDNWKKLSEVDLFKNIKGPPPIPSQNDNLSKKEPVKENNGKNITTRPWVRFWARTLDFILLGILVEIILLIIIIFFKIKIINDYFILLKTKNLYYFYNWNILIIVILFVEPLTMAIFGNTPGKALFSIKVTNNLGGNLTFKEAFKRCLNIWVKGLAFGIPLISLITIYNSYEFLNNYGKTSWDKRYNFIVTHKHIGIFKLLIIILIFLIYIYIYSQVK